MLNKLKLLIKKADTKLDKAEQELRRQAIAAIYDNDGNYFLIMKDRKILMQEKSGSFVEIIDTKKKSEIFELFALGKSDVIR